MPTVKDLLDKKGRVIHSISPDATVYDALQKMADAKVGALLVMDEENAVVGIISERDYARKIILSDRTSRQTKVSEIMSREVIYVDISRTTDECLALMTMQRIRHLPVYDQDHLEGIISIGDVVKAAIDDKEFFIDQLITYINSRPTVNTDK
ncbi:MAG TPA: CBS domain-containing protein [Ignavibacteriales bacterium]|nr:CBS domain-containing protein [Ignavibacteriales bacterium]HEX3072993.1 CBS domain-containing protein [Ignavibacteriales bacterium]